MNTKILQYVVVISLLAMSAINVNAANLSSQQVALVASGQGTEKEQKLYVLDCVMDAPCYLAMMQVWEVNGHAVPIEHYFPSDDKVPAMLRGTEMGEKLRHISAVNACNSDAACRAFLVTTTTSLRALSQDDLKQAAQIKTESDRNHPPKLMTEEDAIAQIAAAAERAEAKNSAPIITPSTTAVAGTLIEFEYDPYTSTTIQLVTAATGNREIQSRSATGLKRLAKVMGHDGKWLIELNDGTQIVATDIQLTRRGFVAGSNSQPVSYSEETGLIKLNWPTGFHTATIQRGNVAQTGYLLFERNATSKSSLGGLMDAFNSVAASVGAARQEDYLMMDLHSGKTYALNISLSGKDVLTMSNCRSKNAVTNVCRDADTKENLYDKLGKNMGHYAWSIYWFRAQTGTYLITLEDAFKNVNVTLLETGEKRVAFTRGLGIRDFSAIQQPDGHLSISAQLAFTVKNLDNVEVAFSGLPLYAVSAEAAKTATAQ